MDVWQEYIDERTRFQRTRRQGIRHKKRSRHNRRSRLLWQVMVAEVEVLFESTRMQEIRQKGQKQTHQNTLSPMTSHGGWGPIRNYQIGQEIRHRKRSRSNPIEKVASTSHGGWGPIRNYQRARNKRNKPNRRSRLLRQAMVSEDLLEMTGRQEIRHKKRKRPNRRSRLLRQAMVTEVLFQ